MRLAGRVPPGSPRMRRAGERFGTDPPGRCTTPRSPASHRVGRRPRSVFFCRGIRVGHLDDAALAFAKHGTGGAPGSGLLRRGAGLMEHPPDGVGGNHGQAIGSRAESLLKCRQAPRGGAVGFRGGLAASFLKDAFPGRPVVDRDSAAAVARIKGGQSLGVEACDEVRDGVTGTSADRLGGLLIIASPSDSQDQARPGDPSGRLALRPAQLGQDGDLVVSERSRWIDFSMRHSGPQVSRSTDHSSITALWQWAGQVTH